MHCAVVCARMQQFVAINQYLLLQDWTDSCSINFRFSPCIFKVNHFYWL